MKIIFLCVVLCTPAFYAVAEPVKILVSNFVVNSEFDGIHGPIVGFSVEGSQRTFWQSLNFIGEISAAYAPKIDINNGEVYKIQGGLQYREKFSFSVSVAYVIQVTSQYNKGLWFGMFDLQYGIKSVKISYLVSIPTEDKGIYRFAPQIQVKFNDKWFLRTGLGWGWSKDASGLTAMSSFGKIIK